MTQQIDSELFADVSVLRSSESKKVLFGIISVGVLYSLKCGRILAHNFNFIRGFTDTGAISLSRLESLHFMLLFLSYFIL